VAKWLAAPVVLVLDAGAMARSAGAVALGFERFDPALRVAGVIANRVGGAAHARFLFDAIRGACRAEPLGAIAGSRDLAMPERHLGLHTAADGALTTGLIGRLGDAVEQGVDLDRLLALAAPLPAAPVALPPRVPPRARIGVARDAAFQFYYAENLDRLHAAGAAIVEWSPLADADVPDVDGLYLGGGYPELHAAQLADNAALRKSVRRFAEAGRPIYAECGGLMFLADSLEDVAGRVHPMVGLLPAAVRMREHGLTLGYAEVTLAAPTLLGPAGTVVRGQEFHASTLGVVPPSITRAYRVRAPGGGERAEGYMLGRALMSYVHLHFASCPAVATAFVDACAAR
jgi:cobyrinic acid a,c-diamide synthase